MKNILITGCDTGIGFNCAISLQQKNTQYQVFATVLTKSAKVKLSKIGIKTYLMNMDNSEQIQSVTNNILLDAEYNIYAVFHNAGYGQPGAVEDLTRDLIRVQFETNVFGVLELTNLILPSMRAKNNGKIIVNSSLLGIVAMQYRGAYNASKFALEGLFDTLRLELSGTNISVSLIEPGPIESEFRANAFLKFKENIDIKSSPHRQKYQTMIERLSAKQSQSAFTLSPDFVTKRVLKILTQKYPKAHYPVTVPAYFAFWLRRILPTFLLDKIAKIAGK